MSHDMNWESVFRIPTETEIAQYNHQNHIRSPYLYGWFSIPRDTKYTEYAVEFKADHLPRGTYCCVGNWFMDYTMVDTTYGKRIADPNGIDGYAGFQHIYNGDKVGIMAFWDVFYQDAAGRKQFFRAKKAYPRTLSDNESFDNEGSGAHCIVPYAWEARHWYRMHLRCIPSKHTGNTMVEQWACDLETGEYTLICTYDIGVKGSSFQGPACVFLENYMVEHAGDVRSMEVRRPQYRDAADGQWKPIHEVYVGSQDGYPHYRGSYKFGVNGDRLWMITSGVGGDWYHDGQGQQPTYLTLE